MKTSALAIAAALAVAGCGGDPDVPIAIRMESSQEWAQRADAVPRLVALAGAAAAYWGGSLQELAGWTVTLVDGMPMCGAFPSVGCTYPGAHDVYVSATDNVASPAVVCAEATSLAHEIGHALIGDGDHLDPRWDRRALNDLALELVPATDQTCVDWFGGVLY